MCVCDAAQPPSLGASLAVTGLAVTGLAVTVFRLDSQIEEKEGEGEGSGTTRNLFSTMRGISSALRWVLVEAELMARSIRRLIGRSADPTM